MKIQITCSTLILAAGLCTTVWADEPVPSDDYLPTRLAGYVYINAATGERTLTRPHASRLGDLFWDNGDIAGSCNFFFGQDRPTRDTIATGRAKFGSAVVHWGDLPAGSVVDAYDVGYNSNVGCDTAGSGVTGFDMINTFYDDYDGVLDPGGTRATLVAAILVPNLTGGDCSLVTHLFNGWIYTIDLEGSGLEFAIGESDLDGDGRADFGYGYEFVQGQTEAKGICGPFLVRPASLGGHGTAMGCPDQYDWFNQFDGAATRSDYVGAFWFGGGDCSKPTPYASFFLNLYGSAGPGHCAVIDFAADGTVDFADYLEFLNLFDGQDPAADLNQDGLVDFTDYLAFLNLYEACAG